MGTETLHELCVTRTNFDLLVLEGADYPSFRTTRLAPLVKRCPITTRVILPQACVRVVDSSGVEVTEDLPLVTGDVGGLPLPTACTGFNREETLHVFEVVEALQRKVIEMSKAFHLVQRMPALVRPIGRSSKPTDVPTDERSGDMRYSNLCRLFSWTPLVGSQGPSRAGPSEPMREPDTFVVRRGAPRGGKRRKSDYVERQPEGWLEDEDDELC